MGKPKRPVVLDAGQGAGDEAWQCPGWGTAYSHAPGIREWMAEDGSHDRRFRKRGKDGQLGELTGGMARSYGRCWKCHAPLGCAMCTTTNVLEVLCRRCAAWGTFEAFEHHGPVVPNPKVPAPAKEAEYPADWRRHYTPVAEESPWWTGDFTFRSIAELLRKWGIGKERRPAPEGGLAGLVKAIPDADKAVTHTVSQQWLDDTYPEYLPADELDPDAAALRLGNRRFYALLPQVRTPAELEALARAHLQADALAFQVTRAHAWAQRLGERGPR
jgi:hypothetical protein